MPNDSIVVVGSLNCDMVFQVSRLPQRGETFTADGLSMCGGGKGANQAVQCAKLGATTYMAGKVGQDSFGDDLLRGLELYGVDISHVSRSNLHTGLASVQALPNGSVHATISTGANFDMDTDFVDSLEVILPKCKVVILQMEIPIPVVEETIRRAHGYGCYVLLNAAPAKPISSDALKLVDCLVVNETEAGFYAGTTIDDVTSAEANAGKLLSMVNGKVIITLGKQGSLLCRQEGNTHFTADETVTAIETTGAGDSYIGALAYQVLLGAEEEAACRFASRAADITVTRIGAQQSMPTLSDLDTCH